MKRIGRVREEEVIAEFLKNEFYHPEFQAYRERFEYLVMDTDVSNPVENRLRKALLFKRRATMWRELPPDTEWWEVEFEFQDLGLLRIFPRAHWRNIAKGDFLINNVVYNIRTSDFAGKTREAIARIQALSYRLRQQQEGPTTSAILIGVDDNKPFTIIEGNHRLTAALLASPYIWQSRFRVFCGFSPRMTESCWYDTNLPNLWRYAKNRLRTLIHDPEADVDALVMHLPPRPAAPASAMANLPTPDVPE